MEMTSDAEALAVFVPAPRSEIRDRVWKGSGIVGSVVGDTNRMRIDYEGDTEIYPAYADRVQRAAERHQADRPGGGQGYPTQASAHVSPDQVIEVGRWNPDDAELDVTKPEVLSNWLK